MEMEMQFVKDLLMQYFHVCNQSIHNDRRREESSLDMRLTQGTLHNGLDLNSTALQ